MSIETKSPQSGRVVVRSRKSERRSAPGSASWFLCGVGAAEMKQATIVFKLSLVSVLASERDEES